MGFVQQMVPRRVGSAPFYSAKGQSEFAVVRIAEARFGMCSSVVAASGWALPCGPGKPVRMAHETK